MRRMRIVTGETAMNPVARAVAKAKLRQFLLHTKLRVFSLDDGTDDAGHMGALLNCMQVVARGCELQWPAGMASDVAADHRVLRGGDLGGHAGVAPMGLNTGRGHRGWSGARGEVEHDAGRQERLRGFAAVHGG